MGRTSGKVSCRPALSNTHTGTHAHTCTHAHTQIPHCIANKPMSISIGIGANGGIEHEPKTARELHCETFFSNSPFNPNYSSRTLMTLFPGSQCAGTERADLWVLHIKESEMPIIYTFPWQSIDVRGLMVEDYWTPSRVVNFIMTVNSYRSELQLGLDTVVSKKNYSAWNPQTHLDHWAATCMYGFYGRPKYQGNVPTPRGGWGGRLLYTHDLHARPNATFTQPHTRPNVM